MKFYKASLSAGVGYQIGATGNYFRILSGTQDFRVGFEFPTRSYETNWKVGIGAKLADKFTSLTLISEIDQTIEIAYGFGVIDDSRLTGDVDINGLLSVVNSGASSLANTTATIPAASAELVAANTARQNVVITPDVDCHIGAAGVSVLNARKVLAGQQWSTTGTYSIHAIDAGTAGGAGLTFIEEESI